MIQNLTAQQQSALTGRHKELHQLWNLFEASMTGRTHVVFVSGEPGIGKSRLLQEMAIRAEEVGAIVLRGERLRPKACLPTYLSSKRLVATFARLHENNCAPRPVPWLPSWPRF